MDVSEKTTSKKRLIDADALLNEFLKRYTERERNRNLVFAACEIKQDFADMISDFQTVDAVEVAQFNALKSLVNGEWVDCKLVQEALGIDFGTGLKIFDFSRTAEWNPAPLNGQKITTKFRLKNAVVYGQWETNSDRPDSLICSVCKCGFDMWKHDPHNFCPNCGAKM